MKYETRCVKILLKPNSIEKVREWAATLNATRRGDALMTLRDEGVVLEAAFFDQTPDGDFLIYVMTAENFETAKQAATASTHDIDKYHREFKRGTWQHRQELEVLVDLDRIDEVSGKSAR